MITMTTTTAMTTMIIFYIIVVVVLYIPIVFVSIVIARKFIAPYPPVPPFRRPLAYFTRPEMS